MDEVSRQLTLAPYIDEGVSPDGLSIIKNIPFVIDNQQYTMRDVLNSLLVRHQGHALDIATAYFNVGGWQLLREGIDGLSSFRLLLGDEPEMGADLGLREAGAKPVKGLIRELDEASFNFHDDIEADSADSAATRSAVELSEFQEDAVKKARKILARYDGVMVADSVGLGKTWIGKKLLEDYAYHRRYKAVVICPAALKKMWQEELLEARIPAMIVTQEIFGRENADIHDVADADVLLVDESHNFRNHTTQRYENLERILAANQRNGCISNERKKLILLTATPINNNVFDLYNQINLFTGGDRSYFAAAGIGDLQRYFVEARRINRQQDSSVALFNLLEEVVIRRTRPFIKKAYPNATIKGKPIHWPERKLKTIRYHLEKTYSGIYSQIVGCIEGLCLAPYRLETYKKKGIERKDVVAALQRVNAPQPRVYVKTLKKAYEAFMMSGQISELVNTVMSIGEHTEERESEKVKQTLLKRDDLKLVCFEYVW